MTKRRMVRIIAALVQENRRLSAENARLEKLHQDQARIIHSLRRVLRFLGFDEVRIEDEDEFIDLESQE